ncbi:MAG TPA: pantoate--beta-alanine ligase [Candidatus Polarisedimenticolia bacterium]|nr:pantoate--beta-alanine ligase [Candidatus Polarisedimenticolia bacterium]
MEILTKPEEMAARSRQLRAAGTRIGFVPTMGALHEGHLSLIRKARELADSVVVSVFVNPAQFGESEDLDRYPRNLGRDAEMAGAAGASIVYAPQVEAIYPAGYRTYVSVEGWDALLEGASRPGHFRGVATVVLKLLHRVAPDVACFGQKDAQQAILIRRMVRDLEMDLQIEICPTVREADGLAMSSRNAFLSPQERRAAPVLYRALQHVETQVLQKDERHAKCVLRLIRETLAGEPLVVPDYAAVVSAETLEPIDPLRGQVLVPVAARIGATRLIDNVILKLEE